MAVLSYSISTSFWSTASPINILDLDLRSVYTPCTGSSMLRAAASSKLNIIPVCVFIAAKTKYRAPETWHNNNNHHNIFCLYIHCRVLSTLAIKCLCISFQKLPDLSHDHMHVINLHKYFHSKGPKYCYWIAGNGGDIKQYEMCNNQLFGWMGRCKKWLQTLVRCLIIIPLTVYGIVSLVVRIVTIPIDFTFSSDFSTLAWPIWEYKPQIGWQ